MLLQQVAVVQMAGPAAVDEEQQADVLERFVAEWTRRRWSSFYQIARGRGARDCRSRRIR